MKRVNCKIAKNVASAVVRLALMLTLSISAFAASKTEPCPRCGRLNTNFGYEANFGWTTKTPQSGQYCEPCGKVVPAGEYHMYLYTSDMYYFTCNSSSCSHIDVPDRTYRKLYPNRPTEHYTNGKRDY